MTTRTRRNPETAIALLLLFVGLPLGVALLAGVAWAVWTWPYPATALFVFGWALFLVQGRVNPKEIK